MSTSVKVTAHNFPATVTVSREDGTEEEHVLKDGEIGSYTVTSTQMVTIEEIHELEMVPQDKRDTEHVDGDGNPR